MPAANAVRSSFMRNWFAVEAIPIIAIMGVTVTGVGFYLTRLARGPNVVWSRSNPQPWNTIEQDQGYKLVSVNQKFDKTWSRPWF